MLRVMGNDLVCKVAMERAGGKRAGVRCHGFGDGRSSLGCRYPGANNKGVCLKAEPGDGKE